MCVSKLLSETENKYITRIKEVQWIWMVKPTISPVRAQTVSKASYLYISRVKQTQEGTKYHICWYTCVTNSISQYCIYDRALKNWIYLLDFFCSDIQFNLLLSPYPCFISLLYLDLYVLGDDALIS